MLTIFLLQSTNFANPVYDTMYNNSTTTAGNSSRSEEKTGLLEHANEEAPSTGVDEL